MEPKFIHLSKTNNYEFLISCLPTQGCVELQKDTPFKEHTWHQHPNNETIVILDGGLQLYYGSIIKHCSVGDVIFLPKGVKHASKASEDGCIYLIAFDFLELNG